MEVEKSLKGLILWDVNFHPKETTQNDDRFDKNKNKCESSIDVCMYKQSLIESEDLDCKEWKCGNLVENGKIWLQKQCRIKLRLRKKHPRVDLGSKGTSQF